MQDMQVKGSSSDVYRVSVSSAPSTSSHGSAQDDCDALGDVYVWGEVICDQSANADKNNDSYSTRTDILLPKPLESNLVLDVHHVACGVRHVALVTRQGEVFTWGEESGGRLGHGVGTDVIHPRFIESLAFSDVDFVACGEFHTCAVTLAGELYTWGDGAHNVGLLGHGTHVSHWIPKSVSGPLDGLQVAHVTCGTWHTALITSAGQLFTFGDGTFGILGHGNRESISYPREVESLMGLKTIAVACGVWHTAAIVEVKVTQFSASVSSGKLFTWGDGDKNRLGHGDKETKLKPACLTSLIDYNFHKLACGHSLTAGLTTSGRVFTMGSTVYGQLGNPHSDGKVPCLVEDRLSSEFVAEVACGSYHVAVLTARSEVYTWGKGANGRLGHGDLEDRRTPTLVEALKDRHVKYIACGSNFTASICQHKWVYGTEQSQCSGCKQAFGFTRKRHNCHNCGLVHCHSCSSKKALRAGMAPNPGKPYRVCDSCYIKLNKASQLPSRQMKGIAFAGGFDLQRSKPRAVRTSVIHSANSSRAVSPLLRKSSPPRSATPVPTTSGLSFSKSVRDRLKKTNELLNQEVQMLRAQVDGLKERSDIQEFELQKSAKKAHEAIVLAAEESARSSSAKEVIKNLTTQLKNISERLSLVVYEGEGPVYMPSGTESQPIHQTCSNGEYQLKNDESNGQIMASRTTINSARGNSVLTQDPALKVLHEANDTSKQLQNCTIAQANGTGGHLGIREYNVNGEMSRSSRRVEDLDSKEPVRCKNGENSFKSTSPTSAATQIEAEGTEQYEPGVYISLLSLQDGTRDLKTVRFSRKRFVENQAETWWSENREKVYEKYNVRISNRTSQAQ